MSKENYLNSISFQGIKIYQTFFDGYSYEIYKKSKLKVI